MWLTYSTSKALIPTAVALGNFDGLHCGHQQVIQPVLNFVRRQETRDKRQNLEFRIQNSGESPYVPLTSHPYATVVTFNPHPQEFFTGQPRALLTPLPEKAQQLLSWGIEQLVLLPFDPELAALSPQDFVEKILVQQLHAQMISVGEDFRFGKQRSGAATDLQAIAARFGIPVNVVPLHTCDGESSTKTLRERISSSSIRQALSEGNIKRAKQLLDRPYTLTGTVVKGQQLGRTIGFPTANIQLPANKFLPRHGVYAVRVFIEGERQEASVDPVTERQKDGETATALPVSSSACLVTPTSYLLPLGIGVMNIGYRPTVNGTSQSVEVHLLDWSGDLYGKTLTVQLKEFLRPEQKFASLEALKAQILADCAIAKSLLIPEATEYKTVD